MAIVWPRPLPVNDRPAPNQSRRHGNRRVRWPAWVALVLLSVVALPSAPAGADSVQGANVYLNWGGGQAVALTSTITIGQVAPSTFWATDWAWAGTTGGGYVGIQTNGSGPTGAVQDQVIFSAWGASAGQGPCLSFNEGGGGGWSCRIPITVSAGSSYTFTVAPINDLASPVWWKATVTGPHGTIDIGHLAVPARTLSTVSSFIENFGQGSGCSAILPATATVTRPQLVLLNGTHPAQLAPAATYATCNAYAIALTATTGWLHLGIPSAGSRPPTR
jgi:hypothetical protein